MKIVIDISDCMFEVIKRSGSGAPKAIDDAIVNGTPLPKGHGRLIDADNASEVMMNAMCGTGYQSMAMRVVESEFYTPTIIEADKEEQE